MASELFFFVYKVLGSIVEVPPPVREFQENIMLLGLWHSPSSPRADILITDVINQVISLQNNGFFVDLGFKGKLTLLDAVKHYKDLI